MASEAHALRPVAERDALEFISGAALVAVDDDLGIVSWNRAAEELTAVPAERALGRRDDQICPLTGPGIRRYGALETRKLRQRVREWHAFS